MTYNKLLSECEKELDIPRKFDDDWRMNFYRFKHHKLYDKDCKLDPLVVWTQIRSFIKSSIEAVHEGQPLTREEYLNLGAKQCRLAPAQRELAYNAFEFYQKNMGKWWDDTDRVALILRALQNSNDTQFKLRRTKLYVDEVQDYTQVRPIVDTHRSARPSSTILFVHHEALLFCFSSAHLSSFLFSLYCDSTRVFNRPKLPCSLCYVRQKASFLLATQRSQLRKASTFVLKTFVSWLTVYLKKTDRTFPTNQQCSRSIFAVTRGCCK